MIDDITAYYYCISLRKTDLKERLTGDAESVRSSLLDQVLGTGVIKCKLRIERNIPEFSGYSIGRPFILETEIGQDYS